MTNSRKMPSAKNLTLAIVPLGIATNIALGTLAHSLKLPIYVDAVGTIIVTILLGCRAGVTVGVLSFLLAGLLTNPVLPWFSGTQAAIAIFVYFVASRGWFADIQHVVISGIGLGVVAGIVSAPVIAILFGGITGSGASVITAFLIASGQSIIKAVFYSGLAAEPIDKTIQCVLAYKVLRSMPMSVLMYFPSPLLMKNRLVNINEIK